MSAPAHAAANAQDRLFAGRVCPSDYAYPPSVFARPADLTADTLYIAGGLYGNLDALDAIEQMRSAERSPPTVVFNGDFHWFDADRAWFGAIERGVSPHYALRGNVEFEIARRTDIGAGCGCAYPDSVSDDVVGRSNEILSILKRTAPAEACARLGKLPLHLVAGVGRLKVAIVHGDAAALAGWRFAHDEIDNVSRRGWLADVHAAAQVDVFACTHTCLAALRHIRLPRGDLTVINNGAAGMPNFSGTTFGVITRISTSPSPHPPLYGRVRDGVHVEAIEVAYDQAAFMRRFLARWPEGTAAHNSYFERIAAGPGYSLAQAYPRHA